ncbi:lipid-A-disaccharide synthase [Terrihabitans rhizophilus]|uniref:Lipid-A-disaccharide synthase n=1 Tax=Terrihabitans rhizophilus TaxID=3092662 RepID=A0ABU4RKU9_9HYPH|nr:lipid-A-disaccharide synthase [Terrihabitans sp. PJ23]MDX6805462.1 lipid-A-disaccharide synthase [Terrihabitans sp. PJ23]
MTRPLDVFLVTGEHSGDQLGFKLMAALKDLTEGQVTFRGVGGPRMIDEGMESLFPMEDIAVMGFAPVIRRLPLLLRRIRETARAVTDRPPDVLVIIDSPDFTHRVARRARARLPALPVVDYVSPTVWAWRSGRARTMREYVDHVLALLPFEPEAHRRLGGPACTYVGHPLVERLAEFRPHAGERPPITDGARLLLLPGSRASVLERHMPLFGEVLARLPEAPRDLVIPTMPRLEAEVARLSSDWPQRPRIVTGEPAKLEAFRTSNAALAASGTVTLELAVSGVPMIGVYRTDRLTDVLRRFVKIEARHILLPNLILDDRVIPEFVADDAEPAAIARALGSLLTDSPERQAQMRGLARLDERMRVEEPPSVLAARIVKAVAEKPA